MPLCDKRLVVLAGKPERQRRLLPDDEPDRTASTSRCPAGSSGSSPTTSTSTATRSRSGTASRGRSANIPVGIRDYTCRLITTVKTDENGAYEALLPSTETFNCPIPQGPCPGMYIVVVNDPGDKDHPNANYNPNYLTASLAWDVWPGHDDPARHAARPDLRARPASCRQHAGAAAGLQAVRARRATRPQRGRSRSRATSSVRHAGTVIAHRSGAGAVADADVHRRPGTSPGIVSWSDRQIVIRVPAVGTTGTTFRPGPKQLSIRTASGLVDDERASRSTCAATRGGINYQPTPVLRRPHRRSPRDPERDRRRKPPAACSSCSRAPTTRT